MSLRDIGENSYSIIRDILNESNNQTKLYNFLVKTLKHENINARLYLNVDYDWFITNIPVPQKL